MIDVARPLPIPSPVTGVGREIPLPVRLVPFHGEVPERLAGFFESLTPWTWRDLRTVFCRHPETRRLVNIIRTIDLILEKAPHTLARGHWSISGYRAALSQFEGAISRLGQLAGLVADDARVNHRVFPERRSPKPTPEEKRRAPVPVRSSSGPTNRPGGPVTAARRKDTA